MVDASDFICCTYVHVHSHMCSSNIAYMCNLVGIFVSGTCVIISCEVDDVVCCLLAYICAQDSTE